MAVKLYLQLESTEEPILYDIVKYVEPTQINKPMFLFLFQETIFQLVPKQDQDRLYKYPLLITIIDIIIYL
jgi:hypothetical protein